MDNKTIVLSTARAIRQEQLRDDNISTFLPNYITMGEFISKLCIVNGYKYIDEDTRTLLLLEASEFKNFQKLQIQRNFFTFTKNSTYIFKFFQELSAEKYDIEKLRDADLYAEYEEHISILIELYKRYESLCDEKGCLDSIFLPKLYKFNKTFLDSHKEITITIDGHLTNFEFELLEQVSNYSKVSISFVASEFNKKMQDRFLSFGIELEVNYKYLIDFNNKCVISKEKIIQHKNITCTNFSESLLQVAFVKKKIYEFVKMGYKPQNIAVVVPDESMAEVLKKFDFSSNLNLAMGTTYTKTKIYTKLDATIKYIDQGSKENGARLDRVEDDIYNKLYQSYYKSIKDVDFIPMLESFSESFSDKVELEIYKEELYKFESLLKSVDDLSVKGALNLFMQRLSARSIDDIRGGKVIVLGVLETRSVEFDAVVILDFDDKNVPKRSDKDMFLNTKIREIANLPTMQDRENLQKHYYFMLINSSKEVAISYVDSAQNEGSRFLKYLGIKESLEYDEREYARLLFEEHKKGIYEEDDSTMIEYSFKDVKLSATSLKTYLTCKRKYYYKYIKGIKNHEIPKDMPKEYEIGNDVHKALQNLYSKKDSYSDAVELRIDLNKELELLRDKNEFHSYLIDMQKKYLDKFVDLEISRFEQGYKVLHTEKSFEVEHEGIKLFGYIDRVDTIDDSLEVLDYKTGNYTLYNKNNFTDATDFQMEFYHILASSIGNVKRCAFYDLKDTKIVDELFLEEKYSILNSHIKDLLALESIEIRRCEDIKNCIYCEYATICSR